MLFDIQMTDLTGWLLHANFFPRRSFRLLLFLFHIKTIIWSWKFYFHLELIPRHLRHIVFFSVSNMYLIQYVWMENAWLCVLCFRYKRYRRQINGAEPVELDDYLALCTPQMIDLAFNCLWLFLNIQSRIIDDLMNH